MFFVEKLANEKIDLIYVFIRSVNNCLHNKVFNRIDLTYSVTEATTLVYKIQVTN